MEEKRVYVAYRQDYQHTQEVQHRSLGTDH